MMTNVLVTGVIVEVRRRFEDETAEILENHGIKISFIREIGLKVDGFDYEFSRFHCGQISWPDLNKLIEALDKVEWNCGIKL